jgi:hypothetical protein
MIPTEAEEQATFVQWLEIKGYKFTAIPNSTYTKSWKQKVHNRAMGLRAGFPDLAIIVNDIFCCVELKRLKGGTLSQEQKSWIEALENAGIPAKVCKGADEAMNFIEALEKGASYAIQE